MEKIWKHRETPKHYFNYFYNEISKRMAGVKDEKYIVGFVNNFNPKKNKIIVNLGIGPGRELPWLVKLKNISEIIGVDYSPAMLSFCKKQAEKYKKKITLIKDNFFTLKKLSKIVKKEKKPIIFICLLNTIGNFTEKKRIKILKIFKRLMQKQDRLILTVYKPIEKVRINIKRFPPHLRPVSKEDISKLYEIMICAVAGFFWDSAFTYYEGKMPQFGYNKRTRDLTVHVERKKIYISHRFTEKEIKELHKKANLKIEKLIEGKLMFIVVSKNKK